jgi:glycosyltransferase involved in cell wall biosynthesis
MRDVHGKPRVFISIATSVLGGPGKGILQFLNNGGMSLCDPLVCNFFLPPEEPWQFRDEYLKAGVRFTSLRQRIVYDPLLIPQAYRLVRTDCTQILQSHGYKSHVLCLALKLLTGLPWIAFVHGWTTENRKMHLYRWLDLALLRFADRDVVVAESLRGQLVSAGIDDRKIITIHNAIDMREYPSDLNSDIRERYGISNDDCLIGVIGRFSPEKGHTHFIEALRRLNSERPHVKALLVGSGQEEQGIRNQVAQSGLNGHVVFVAYQENVIQFIQAFDILALSSLSEGMPNVVLEAMACAKPVVATRVGGVPELVVDGLTGSLVDAANPEQLSSALKTFIDDRGRARACGEAGRTRILKEFNCKDRVHQIIALYNELLQKE